MVRRRDDDPFDDLFREIERLMENVMGTAGDVDVSAAGGHDTHVDVHEYDDHITVIADLPGVEKDDVDLQCTDRTLSIRAAGPSRSYAERVRLPAPVDGSTATATYNNGILEVRLRRADESTHIDVS